jgi:hypothetical protein
VGAITGRDVQSFAEDLHAGHCAGTVRRIIATLIALLDFAVNHHQIEANSARLRLTLGHDRHGHPLHLVLEPAELLAVWEDQRRRSPLADVTLFLGLTGLRWGEFVALRPGDLLTTTTGGPMVHVARSIVRARGEGPPLVTSTKTGSDRMVPRQGQGRTTGPRSRRQPAAAVDVPPAGSLDPDRPSQVPHPRPAAQLRHQPAQERRRHPSESRASSATPAPPPCATTATSPETSTYAPPWTTTRRPWRNGTCPRTSTRTRPPVRVGSPPSGPTRRRAHPRNSTQKPARKAERANAHA